MLIYVPFRSFYRTSAHDRQKIAEATRTEPAAIYLSCVVKQRVLCPSRLHRSRLFEPGSSSVFACHSSDEPSRRNVTAGRAYSVQTLPGCIHIQVKDSTNFLAFRFHLDGAAHPALHREFVALLHRLDFPRHYYDGTQRKNVTDGRS